MVSVNVLGGTLALALLVAGSDQGVASTCYGTPERGLLRDGCALPSSGTNFGAYSSLGSAMGRTYVHCTVAEVVTAAYADLARRSPDVRFVYGETGLSSGGRFRPHKSHQNGLSVDFFVPVRDKAGRSVPLPTSLGNHWGYDIEFSHEGRYQDLSIDFDAIGAHLAALRQAAASRHVSISHVFFATELQPYLRRTRYWPAIHDLPFSTRQGWWRHDEHYHIDFAIPCKRLPRAGPKAVR